MDKKFKDKIGLKFIGGKGGHGAIAFYKGRNPEGGIGGNGGSIYVEGSAITYDLNSIYLDFTIKAENGKAGGDKNLTGRNGQDIVMKVPLTTNIYDKHGNLLFCVSKDGQRELIVKGGQGGLGNHFYRTKGLDNLHRSDEGKDGESLDTNLELELFSDVLLIGFPNAGKSSLLNSITNAQSKVASYAFTTLNPQLGRLNGITIMDLPGLIEGTFEGKGLGTSFVKHTRAAQFLMHLISADTEDVVAEYKKIREELKNIEQALFDKPEVVLLTKTDLVTPDVVEKKVKELKAVNPEVMACSVYDLDSLEAIKELITTRIKKSLAENEIVENSETAGDENAETSTQE